MNKQQSPVPFCWRGGQWDTLPEWAELKYADPQCYWLDIRPVLPEPKSNKPAVFGKGYPVLESGWAFDELYLFWETCALRVVAWEGGGYRWFEYFEGKCPTNDGWESLESVEKIPSPVLLRKRGDWEDPGKMCKVEYIYDNQVVAWRLIKDGEVPVSATTKPTAEGRECCS